MGDRRAVAGILVILGSLANIGTGQQNASEDRFLALEKAWMNALAAHDVAALEEVLAPAFTIIGAGSAADGPVGDRAEWPRNAAAFPGLAHDVRLCRRNSPFSSLPPV